MQSYRMTNIPIVQILSIVSRNARALQPGRVIVRIALLCEAKGVLWKEENNGWARTVWLV